MRWSNKWFSEEPMTGPQPRLHLSILWSHNKFKSTARRDTFRTLPFKRQSLAATCASVNWIVGLGFVFVIVQVIFVSIPPTRFKSRDDWCRGSVIPGTASVILLFERLSKSEDWSLLPRRGWVASAIFSVTTLELPKGIRNFGHPIYDGLWSSVCPDESEVRLTQR